MSVLYDFRCLSRGRLVDFLGSPAPEAFAGRHGAVGDFEDRVARAGTEQRRPRRLPRPDEKWTV